MKITQPTKMITLDEIAVVILNVLVSEEFLRLARMFEAAFTRTRKLTLPILVCFMLKLVKNTTRVAIDRFPMVLNVELNISQQAFSKARQKFNAEALRLLMDEVNEAVYQSGYRTWRGFRVLAIDGTKIQLPSDKKLKKVFGTSGGSDAAVTAQGSTLFDVLNGIVLDARLGPMTNSERAQAVSHLDYLNSAFPCSKDLVVFDRGYPSFELFQDCEARSIKYIMRVRSKFNSDIDKLELGCHNFTLCQKGKEINLRIIKFRLSTGETETLATNLFDYKLGQKHFKKLYSLRWGIEVRYGMLKHGLEIENFSSRTVEGIYQDFYVTVLFHNIVIIGSWEAQALIDESDKTRPKKYKYKVNFNQAVGFCKDRFVEALLESDPDKQAESIREIIKRLVKAVSPIRPNRIVPRNPNPRKAKFYHNKKSNC